MVQKQPFAAALTGTLCVLILVQSIPTIAAQPSTAASFIILDTYNSATYGTKRLYGFGLDSFFGAAVLMEQAGRHSTTSPYYLFDRTVEGLKHNEFEQYAWDVIVFYFARLAYNDPAVLKTFRTRWQSAEGLSRNLLSEILYYAQDKDFMEWAKKVYRETRSRDQKEFLRILLQKRNTVKINLAAYVVNTCADVEILWAEYLATGDLLAIQRVIDEVANGRQDPQGALLSVAAASSLAQRAGWFDDVKTLCLRQHENASAEHKALWQDVVDRIVPLGDGSEIAVCPVKRIPLDGKEGRAIACGAFYPAMQNGHMDVLGAFSLTCDYIPRQRTRLSEQWDLYGRFELFTTIESLISDGHNVSFNALVKHLGSLDGTNQRIYINRQSQRDQARCTMILHLTAEQKQQGIPVWDFARAVNLARTGYEVHYLSPTETTRLTIALAAELQKSFDSWEDYGQNFILGRWFWRGSEEDKESAETAVEKLLTDPKSPWKIYPWEMPLH